MRKRMTKSVVLAAAVITSIFALGGAASAYLSYIDSQATLSGNWIWWRTGYDWQVPDSVHFRGYAASGGTPASPGTFDSISASSWAGASCDNGLTFPYSASGASTSYNSTLSVANTTDIFMPTCSSSPKYRSSSYHQWSDGLWSAGKSQQWNQ